MAKHYKCPKCDECSVSIKDKYKLGHWKTMHCSNCNALLCGQPIVLILAYILYIWVFAWFVAWAYLEHTFMPLLYLIPIWLILDYFNVEGLPLSVLRKKH